MADTNLTDAERAELEQLRAEKAQREAEAAAAKERAELEALRAEKAAAESAAKTAAAAKAQAQAEAEAAQAQAAKEAELDKRDAEIRERAREMMEPDEDLRMPLAQKIVLFVIAVLIAWFVVYVVIPGMGA